MTDRLRTQEMLDLTCKMWDDPLVHHYQDQQPVPGNVPSIFLVGPSSREDVLNFKWRPFAVHFLRKFGFDGVIIVPEPRNDDWGFKHSLLIPIVSWERARILTVSKVVAWVPRHATQLPGRVTNTELGFLAGMAYASPERFKNRIIWGYPPNAWKMKSEYHWVAETAGIEPFHNLEKMCKHVASSFN